MTDELYEELDRIFAARDRNDMAPTIAALQPLYRKHSRPMRASLFETRGAYDTVRRRGARNGCDLTA